MSATQERRSSPAAGTPSAGGLPAASLTEALGIVLTGVVPALVRGLFATRKRAMKVLTAIETDTRTVSMLSSIRRKHGGEGVRLLGGRLVVLWGAGAIQEVLDRSAELYASDSGAKGKGMAHFQPQALTLSRGEEWRDRRQFTEAVLATSERVHPFAGRFLAVVADEVGRMRIGDALKWGDWEPLFDHITLRIIFGDRARGEQATTELLEKLMSQANRLVGLSENDTYYEFFGELERHVREPEPESLVALSLDAPHGDRTRVVHQLPHWMFAMRDTLATNAYRALALIVSDPGVEARVREEMEGADLRDPGALDSMLYLEGCLQEAMRLWPTTPLLARQTMDEVTLAGERLDEGTQVIMLNVFNHRDPDHVEDADLCRPERWAEEAHDYRFNHLSNGSQNCPGGPLVLLLGKAVLAGVLNEYSLALESPTLEPGKPLPHMLDFFAERFAAEYRAEP